MSFTETSSQTTNVSYGTVESIFKWIIKNPTELSKVITSKTVKIPSINGEWYLTVEGRSLQFHMKINNDGRNKIVEEVNSKDQYCFEFGVNGSKTTSFGYKTLSEHIKDGFKFHVNSTKELTINAKVTIGTSQKCILKLVDFENKLNRLSDDFGALLSDCTLSDFTIIVKSKEFKVHKLVLSVRSPVFDTMFRSNMKEAADNKVEINDIEPCTFEHLLIFIYSGKIPEDMNYYAMDLFVAADNYGVEDLKNQCEKHIAENVSIDNAMAVYKLSNLYQCRYDLQQMSFNLIKEKLQESTIVGDYAKSVDADNLEELLEIKKSFETRIIESFENNENGEQIR